jgi:predicted DCC family thiol-disulfide oxidoreductase YuxK
MPASPEQGPHRASRHLLLYDGVCGFCNHLVQFVLARDRGHRIVFAALQSDAGKSTVTACGGDPDVLSTLYVVANHGTPEARVLTRSRAALFLARELGWPWKAAGLFGILPTPLLDAVYNVIARHRYRLFGKHDQCLIPRPEDRARFIG